MPRIISKVGWGPVLNETGWKAPRQIDRPATVIGIPKVSGSRDVSRGWMKITFPPTLKAKLISSVHGTVQMGPTPCRFRNWAPGTLLYIASATLLNRGEGWVSREISFDE
jgi:hypothetical protein